MNVSSYYVQNEDKSRFILINFTFYTTFIVLNQTTVETPNFLMHGTINSRIGFNGEFKKAVNSNQT